MFSRGTTLEKSDPELWAAVAAENRRQEEHIELIASGELREHRRSSPRRDRS